MTDPDTARSPRVRLRLTAALLALAAGVAALTLAVLLVHSALADGDPASDTLLGADVFFPYSPPVSASLERVLTAETAAAKRAGFPIKVALIEAPTDLGAIPSLFGKPQQYAEFLDQEISLIGTPHPPLLVVMPDGYGVVGLPPATAGAASALAKPDTARRSDGLARAAIAAVQTLAAANGHRIEVPPAPGRKRHGNSDAALIAIILGAIAISAAALTALRRGRRERLNQRRR